MKQFILKRLVFGVVVLFMVILMTFVITRVVPSDPAKKWVGARATEDQLEQARVELGLDKPLTQQFGLYFGGILQGDLGVSLRSKQEVSKEIQTYLPATLELILISTLAAILVGVPLGVISAVKKDKLLDHFSRFFSVSVVSFPAFWIAIFLQLVFYRWLGWLPLGNRVSLEYSLLGELPNITGFLVLDALLTFNFPLMKDALLHLILPGITIALYPIGLVARMTRSALLEILNEDYIYAAKSYGLKQRLIVWRYALKNSLGPTITVVTLSIGFSLVNTFLVESIFNWPGIGSYIAISVTSLDYPAIMGVTIISTIAYVFLNLIADIVIALDPRIRI